MRLKLDENLGHSAAAQCRAAGHDTSTVVDQALSGADDRRVFLACGNEGRALITLDLDFANPFVFDPTDSAGVVVLRLPKSHGHTDLAAAMESFLHAARDHDVRGKLWIVSRGRVRQFEPPRGAD